MANPSTAHEPSMEEILASIRQIISEDSEAAAAPGEKQNEAIDRTPADVVEFASGGREPESPAKSAPEQAPRQHPAKSAPLSETTMPAQPRDIAAPPQPQPVPFQPSSCDPAPSAAKPEGKAIRDDRLLSSQADEAVSGAFSALAHTILAQNARTLEDLVSEMLRPMLKEWLDDNLPPLVERLVREEIERVSRGRR